MRKAKTPDRRRFLPGSKYGNQFIPQQGHTQALPQGRSDADCAACSQHKFKFCRGRSKLRLASLGPSPEPNSILDFSRKSCWPLRPAEADDGVNRLHGKELLTLPSSPTIASVAKSGQLSLYDIAMSTSLRVWGKCKLIGAWKKLYRGT